MNKWLIESKALSMSTVKRKPLIFKIFFTSNISGINPPPSLKNLFSK